MRLKTSLALLLGCGAFAQRVEVSVKNDLDFDRREIVSIPVSKLQKLLRNGKDFVHVTPKGNSNDVLVQWVDSDADGTADELLFEAQVSANSEAKFNIQYDKYYQETKPEAIAYSRFAPERTDDYAWENDKVAFRVYGPDAQHRFEQKRENGTLSSGVDIWLKRTSKLVIDKWYAGYKTDPNYYHKDRGDGYDPYHVGASRGTGGTGVWANDSLYVSKNFTSWKTIANGPLRTIFELSYAPYSPFGVIETKRVSLDVGSNFSKFEISLRSNIEIPGYAIGIALHDGKGETSINEANGIFSHFEKIDDAFVGEGVVICPAEVVSAFVHTASTPDQSHLIISTSAQSKLVYYAGFAWTKSAQIANRGDWAKMLEREAQIVSHPLIVDIR